MKRTFYLSLVAFASLFVLSAGGAFAAPRIEVAWPEELGYPDSINWSGGWMDVFIGGPYEVDLKVFNRGDETLRIDQIGVTPEVFTVEPATIEVQPGDSAQIVITFESQNHDEYQGSLSIESNDPERGRVEIPLYACAFGPPVLWPPDRGIDEDLRSGEILRRELVLENHGETALRFMIEIWGEDQAPDWLSVEPTEGEIEAGGMIAITVILDATTVEGGDYNAELRVLTNDPANPEIAISVHMWVSEDWPLYPVWPEELGWPEVLDFNRAFGDIYVDTPETLSVSLQNLGTDTLRIDDAFFDSDQFSIFPRDGEIPPDEQLDFSVVFMAGDVDDYSSTGSIQTNDAGNPEIHFPVHARTSLPAGIWTRPADGGSFTVRWAPGDENPWDREIEIGNAAGGGRADLCWQAEEDAEWLTCTPTEGRIAAGEDASIVLSFETQGLQEYLYETAVRISSNDPAMPVVEIGVILAGIVLDDPHWPIPGNINHSVLVTDVRFNDATVDRGWEVGVFGPNGVCCGAEVWFGPGDMMGLAAYGADQNYPDYFQDGELMSFKLWDPIAGREYSARASITEGGLEWHDGGFTMLSLEHVPVDGHVIPLRQGWNINSFNFIPVQDYWTRQDGPDLRRLFLQFREDPHAVGSSKVIIVKNARGQFFAVRMYDFNTIPFWNLTEGYQVLASDACEGEWIGQQIPPDADIPISRGWNLIAYYPTYQLSASRGSNFYVLSPILDHVIIAKDDEGHFMHRANNFSNMAPWREGKGYQIKVDADVVLNYPAEQRMMMNDDDVDQMQPEHFQSVSRTGRNMSVLLKAEFGMRNLEWGEIGVFTESGLCVGSTDLRVGNSGHRIALTDTEVGATRVGLAVWGDDPSTPEVDGAVEGEALGFRLWDGQAETPILLEWTEGEGKYSTDGFTSGIINLEGAKSTKLPSEYALHEAFPNPFNSTMQIRYDLPKECWASVTLCDIDGKQVTRMFEGVQGAGQHSASFDGQGLAGGTYFVRLDAGTVSRVRKVVLVK